MSSLSKPVRFLDFSEVPSRRNLHRNPNHAATQYIQQRPHGFSFIHSLKEPNVFLFISCIDPTEKVVYKREEGFILHGFVADGKTPPEITISTMSDPLVRRQLPLRSLSVFPELLAFQVYGDGPVPERDCSVGLFYRYYNLGTLNGMSDFYCRYQMQCPEYLIWHIIAQVGRAYCYLHTGRIIPESGDIGSGQPHSHGVEGGNLPWKPISHHDGHSANIWLHEPSAEEKQHNPLLARFSKPLPQVILGDFGLAFEAEIAHDFFQAAGIAQIPEWETWRDKALFGHVIKQLVFATMPNGRAYPSMEGYSNDLVLVMRKFEPLVRMLEHESLSFNDLLRLSGRHEWETWPDNAWVYGVLVAMADWHVGNYIRSA